MSLTKWLIPPRMSIAVFEEGNPGMFVSIPCTTASSRQKLKFKFAMKSLINLIYQSKPFCIAPEAIKSFFLSPSRSEMFDRTKGPTSRPDSNRSSHPASAQGAHHGRWTWVVGLATSYYVLKNDTQNIFFNCSWNYHFLPPVSDASANLLAYIFVVTCHSFAHELMFSRFE